MSNESKITIHPSSLNRTKPSSPSLLSSTSLSVAEGDQQEPPEEYLTGLEGIGKIESIDNLHGIEFSPSSTSAGGSGSEESEGVGSVSSTSSVADLQKRSTRTFEWIERMLASVYGGNDGSGVKKVSVIDYQLEGFDQLTTVNDVTIPMLSKLLTLKIKFKVQGHEDTKYELLVVKVPPDSSEERELARMAFAHQREVNFYGRIIPYLQDWTMQQNVETAFAIPACYYGRFQRHLDDKPIDNLHDNIAGAEAILVLQDLRVYEFGKKHFSEGLTIDETKAVICEIGKIHGITWSLKEKDGLSLDQLFDVLHKPMEVVNLYETLLQSGLQKLKVHLHKSSNGAGFPTADILHKIRSLEAKLRPRLVELLEPSHNPIAPTCLLHMDLWSDNILFRKRDVDDLPPTAAAGSNFVTSDGLLAGGRAMEGFNYIDPIPASVGLDQGKDFITANAEPSSSTSQQPQQEKPATEPSYIQYLTDPAYANLDLLRGTTKTITTFDPLGNLVTKVKIMDSPLECRILDWQMASFGRAMHDIALLLVISLEPELRRKYTDHFLRYYFQVFEDTANTFGMRLPFDFDCIQREYRQSKLLAFLFAVASIDLALADQMTEERLMEILKELFEDGIL